MEESRPKKKSKAGLSPSMRQKQLPLSQLSKEELEARVRQLEAHNTQLRNLLSKKEEEATPSSSINDRSPKRKFDFSRYKPYPCMSCYHCISCTREVLPSQQALHCESCPSGQHRTCGTGIKQDIHRKPNENNTSVFSCHSCSTSIISPAFPVTAIPVDPQSVSLDDALAAPTIRLVSLYDSPFMDSSQASSVASTAATSSSASSIPSPNASDRQEASAPQFSKDQHEEESNLEQSPPMPDLETTNADVPYFSLVIEGSRKGGDLLISREGYTYNKDGNPNKKGHQRWKCAVRTKKINCLASVMQCGDVFTESVNQHLCTPKDCTLSTASMRAVLRCEGKNRPLVSASAIVKETMEKHLPLDAPAKSRPLMNALIRSTNRLRQKKKTKRAQ